MCHANGEAGFILLSYSLGKPLEFFLIIFFSKPALLRVVEAEDVEDVEVMGHSVRMRCPR